MIMKKITKKQLNEANNKRIELLNTLKNLVNDFNANNEVVIVNGIEFNVDLTIEDVNDKVLDIIYKDRSWSPESQNMFWSFIEFTDKYMFSVDEVIEQNKFFEEVINNIAA